MSTVILKKKKKKKNIVILKLISQFCSHDHQLCYIPFKFKKNLSFNT